MENAKLHHLPGEKQPQTLIAQCFGALLLILFIFPLRGVRQPQGKSSVESFIPALCLLLVSFLTSAGKRRLFSGNDCIYYARLRKW